MHQRQDKDTVIRTADSNGTQNQTRNTVIGTPLWTPTPPPSLSPLLSFLWCTLTEASRPSTLTEYQGEMEVANLCHGHGDFQDDFL